MRWLGMSLEGETAVLKWISEDAGIQVDAAFSPGQLEVVAVVKEGWKLTDAVKASYELIGHLTRVFAQLNPRRRVALFDLVSEPSGGEERSAWTARQVTQVEVAVNNINPGWLPRLPLLGDLLGLPIPDNATTAALNPELRQQWLIILAVELIQAWARVQPLALIVEDAHWMDEASRRLTQSLGGAIAQSLVMLILVQRSQDESWLPDLNRLSYHHCLDLCELSPHGIEALVADRLQGRLSALAFALIRFYRQGGREVVRLMVDQTLHLLVLAALAVWI
jgi:hypothetical protein